MCTGVMLYRGYPHDVLTTEFVLFSPRVSKTRLFFKTHNYLSTLFDPAARRVPLIRLIHTHTMIHASFLFRYDVIVTVYYKVNHDQIDRSSERV